MVTAGADGLPLLRRVGDEPRGFEWVALATRKGIPGTRVLSRGGELRHVTLFVRYGERVLRTFRLERPQRLLHALAMRSPYARNTMWGGVILLSFVALWQVRGFFRKQPPRYA
jgi:hypothetical protein